MSCDAWTTVEGPLPACMHAVWYLGSILLPRGPGRDAWTTIEGPLPACMHAVWYLGSQMCARRPDACDVLIKNGGL